jgi:hypothetical protein
MKFHVILADKAVKHIDSGIEFEVTQEFTGRQFELKIKKTKENLARIPAEWWAPHKSHVIPHLVMRACEAYSKAFELQKEREAHAAKLKERMVFTSKR